MPTNMTASAPGADDASPPLPPTNLARLNLPVRTLEPGAHLYRIHRLDRAARWFGPGLGKPPANRFDDPRGEYRVCYLALTSEAAFAETFLRRPPVHLLSRAMLDARGVATFVVRRSIAVVELHGSALARLGAAVSNGPHSAARLWSRALWSHPCAPAGLMYRCRHDDDEHAVALFDRAAGAIEEVERIGVRADRAWLGRVMDRYALALDD